MLDNFPAHRLGRVLVNHLGFTCDARKTVIIRGAIHGKYDVEDMSRNRSTHVTTESEAYEVIFTDQLKVMETPFGQFSVGDFSACRTPGVYRVSIPDSGEHSFQFTITDGAFGWLPKVFLEFIHNWRSGDFENAWRGPTHLDDAIRSDNGAQVAMKGGWYDAGDSRKWLAHTFMPALAFMEAHERLPWHYSEWEKVEEGWSPWLLEAKWGLDFLAKFQEAETGMFYEDIGGGGNERKMPGLQWWYENISGCYGDNSDNRFTDNIPNSGDERVLRVRYNPIGQLVSTTILARAHRSYAKIDPSSAAHYLRVSINGWKFANHPDPATFESADVPYSTWTSVRSWYCLAALELWRNGSEVWETVEESIQSLLANFDDEMGFWRNSLDEAEPYRGVLQSAQPILALVEFASAGNESELSHKVLDILRSVLQKYVYPLSELTPFGIIPYGLYRKPASDGDVYRPWKNGLYYRFFMPDNHVQKFNVGLSGHYTSWAHALALLGNLLHEPRCADLAWNQIYWLFGQNFHNATLVSGVGYNNPMPHSRLMGTFPGGFCNGFIGTLADEPNLDTDGNAQWNTTEYWIPLIANTMLALSQLNIPSTADKKIGCTHH